MDTLYIHVQHWNTEIALKQLDIHLQKNEIECLLHNMQKLNQNKSKT